MANVADKASVLRTTKVRTKLKGDGSWLNRNSDTEETTEEKPWLAEIRARRENGESSPVSSPTSSPLPKPDSDKLPTSGFKIRGVFNKVDTSSTSSTSNGISSATSHITKISSDSYKKIAPHTVKPPAEKADSTISSEEQEKRTTAASKALPKTAARERSYVLSAAKKFESQEQAADMSMDNGTTSFVAKRVKVTEEASSNPPPRRSALLSPVAPVPEPKPLNRVSDGVKKTVGHVTFSETTKVEEVHPDREHTFPPPPPPVLAPTKDLLKDRTPDLDDSGDDDTYSLSVHEQVKKFTSKSQSEPEPEPEHFQNSSSRVEALAAMYENLIPSETETSSLKGGEWVMAGKEKDQEDDDSEEEGDGQEPTAGLSNHKATTENLRDLFSGKEKDPLSSHVTTTVTEYSKKKDPLSSHVTSTVTEYSKEKDPLSSYGTTTVTEYSREDPALPAPPSPKPWSKEVTFESKEKDPLSSHVTTTVTEYSREDRALPAPPSPGRLSQDLLTEIESREDRTLPVPPSPKQWQQDLLTEIESREDRTLPVPTSPKQWQQDLLTEIESREDPALPVPTSPKQWQQDLLTEIESREDPALPVPLSPKQWQQDLLTEIESREERTLPVPPSPKQWQQDLLTEIESREDRPLPVTPSPGRLSQDLLTELESREDPALPVPPSPGRLSQDLLTEIESREDPALPVRPSPGRLSQDLLTEIESREDRTLPVPPSPKKWQQDLLTEIESREDPAPSPGRLSQDWLTELESKEKDPLSSHVTTTVTEYSREEPALPVPPSPGRLSQDLLTELESKEKDPLSSHVTTTVTEYSKEKDPLSSYGTTTVTEYSKEKDPLSSHVTTTVTEYSKEKDPLSSYGTTTVTEYSKEKDPLSSYGTTTVTEYSREEPALPAPRSPKRWSKDRLTELESPTKTHSDVTVTTETVTTSIDSEEKDPLSSRSTTTVTKFSSADAYDPYPIGTTSRNSSSDLLKPISDLSINSSSTSFTEKKDPEIMVSGKATVSFADDITPFDTHATSLSTHRSWARKWETTSPLQTHIEESREDLAEAGEEDQQTLVTFERKSKEDDSPWDKWTSPSVYTLTSTTEEEEEEESLEDSQVHTVTTITTIRDSYGRQEEYGMNRTRLQEVARTPSPDPESKKPFVYLKEYINTTELSSHNASDSNNSWSSSYSSSPSTPCTYCGQLVTNDAKITIEHLNINCHPSCFKCYSCHKPMGDLVYNMFLHGGKVHCESCYSAALD
ncbi:zinc finger protein 185 isoform X5 [Nerophis lumbriciformis]|uniref:zinc finger protein 185 isoform X5 n=1 Tax=Nerophis lumbriciformis TaxID=546530 RepID=UPI003BA8ADFC